jgi:hypothetical protein
MVEAHNMLVGVYLLPLIPSRKWKYIIKVDHLSVSIYMSDAVCSHLPLSFVF